MLRFISLLSLYCQLLGSLCFAAQQAQQSPEELVKLLTDKAEELFSLAGSGYPVVCNQAAFQLVRLGRVSLPAIEKALDSIETKRGKARELPAAPWLLYAYASIEQREAYPKLRRMLLNPRLVLRSIWFERSIALSLQLTSFRSTVRGKALIRTFRLEVPQKALDQFLLAWILNDQPAFEETLSPRAKLDLARLLKKQSWRTLRLEHLKKSKELVVAFGYRFLGHPLGIPMGFLQEQPVVLPTIEANPTYQVELYSWGRSCATVRVSFTEFKESQSSIYRLFQVDTENVEALLKELSPCLARPATTR